MKSPTLQAQPKANAKPAQTARNAPATDQPEAFAESLSLSFPFAGRSPGDIPLATQNFNYLQRTIGNHAVGRLIQAKLKIGQPDDQYEQEADRVADRVMRMPAPPAATTEEKEDRIQAKPVAETITPLAQRQVDEEEEPIQAKFDTGLIPSLRRQEQEEEEVQAKPDAHSASQPLAIQRKCPECESGSRQCPKCAEEEELQGKPLRKAISPVIQRAGAEPEEEKETIQPKANSNHTPEVSSKVSDNITAMRGNGRPLPQPAREFFEPRFGVDFSSVRVHTDSRAADSAKAINARAFTVGNDIAFRPGEFSPESANGKSLLAHELTHVVQQGESGFLRYQASPLRVASGNSYQSGPSESSELKGPVPSDLFKLMRAPVEIIYRDPDDEEETTGPILRPDENFRWIGTAENPVLIVRSSWLTANGVASRFQGEITGSRYPEIMRPVAEALLPFYPWASRERVLANLSNLRLNLRTRWWDREETRARLDRSVFVIFGLPPGDPIQIFVSSASVEIYVDTSHLYPQPDQSDVEPLGATKAQVAEQVVRKLETTIGADIPAGRRRNLVNAIERELPNERQVKRFTSRLESLYTFFGESQVRQFLERQRQTTGTDGAVIRISGGNIRLPGGFSPEDLEILTRFFREVFGEPRPEEGTEQGPTIEVSREDLAQLRALLQDRNKDQLIAILREGRGRPRAGGPTPTLGDLIETARAVLDQRQAAQRLRQQLPEGDREHIPVVPRPVHGQIYNRSGLLVPEMEARFEFVTTDRVDAFRVPHVSIRWYAYKKSHTPQARISPNQPVDTEVTNYIELDPDSLLNDRVFEVEFDQPGIYEIHAFVNHNFYLPAHFQINVEVKTELARLTEFERQGRQTWGTEQRRRSYRFRGIETEETVTEVGIGVVAGPAAGVAAEALSGAEEYAVGTRAEGILREGVTSSTVGSREVLREQIQQLESLITEYEVSGDPESREIATWARQRLERLRETERRLSELESGPHASPIATQGFYVSRTAGVPSGQLSLTAWFTYEGEGENRILHGHLLDYSEIVEAEQYHFETRNRNYEAMMEELFLDLTRSYPDGTISFAFQIYSQGRPTRHFVRFTRRTDTLLQDIRQVAFSPAASLAVNLVATALTVFPPTAPIGIGLSLAYNGAATALQLADHIRTDTLRPSDAVDVGLLALDIVPVVGRGTRLFRTGTRTYRVIEATQWAGNIYMLTDEALRQIQSLRDGQLTELARLQADIRQRRITNPSDPELSTLEEQARQLRENIRTAAADVIPQLVAQQGLTYMAQGAFHRLAERHLVTPEAHPTRTTQDPNAPPQHPEPIGENTPHSAHRSGARDAMVEAEVARLGGNPETQEMLRNNDALRTALVDNPLAARALKRCTSPCFPPNATPEQVARLERLLERVARTGEVNQDALTRYFHDRRDNLDQALNNIGHSTNANDLNGLVDYLNRGGTITRGPSPEELPEAQRRRSAEIGVTHGRQQALTDGYQDVGFQNPFEHIGSHGQGFDDIRLDGPDVYTGDIYIVEYKGGGATLDPGQMELAWVIGNIERLHREGSSDGQRWASILARALREGRLKGVVYSTPIVNGLPQPTERRHPPGGRDYPRRNLRGI